MQFPVKEFKTLWYSAQAFGAKTSYGYHDGEDINLKTGGNSDLGKPIHAIADGEVTSIERITTGFGHNLHIKHDGPWGTVWCHYAHCQNISVKVGDKVKEGQKVAEVGHTGNSRDSAGRPVAHLHWAIKKQPSGIGNVANSIEELHKYWLAPIDFVERWMVHTSVEDLEPVQVEKTYTQAEWQIERDERNKNWDLYQDTKKELEQARADIKSRDEEIEKRKKDTEKVIEDFAKALALPASADRITVEARLADLLKVEDAKREIEKKLESEERKHDQEVNDLLNQVSVLKKQIEAQNSQIEELKRHNTTMLTRLESLEEKAEGVQEKKEQINFIQYILENIKGALNAKNKKSNQ